MDLFNSNNSASTFLKSLVPQKLPSVLNTQTVKGGNQSSTTFPVVNTSTNQSATNPTLKTPAAQTYVQNQVTNIPQNNTSNTTQNTSNSNPDNRDPNTGLLINPEGAQYDRNTGKLISQDNSSSTSDTQNKNNNSSTGSSYLDYLNTQFNPTNVGNLQTANQSAQQRLADIQSKEESLSQGFREQQNDILDSSGGLKAGAEQAASVAGRRASTSLADLAVQESAAARSAQVAQGAYNSAIDAGKSIFQAQQDAAKAKQESERYTNETAYKQSQDKISNDLAERKFQEDQKQFGKDYALKAQQVAIAQQEANYKNPNLKVGTAGANDEAANGINLINSLLNNPSINAISGVPGLSAIIPGTKAQLAKNQYEQVKGMLALENRSKLKGQGAVSDFEGRVLDRAASSLGRNLSDTDFQNQLKQIKGAIATSHGLSSDVLLTDPKTGKSQVVNSDSARISQAIQDGLIVEYR